MTTNDPRSKITLVFLIGFLGYGGSERQLYLLLRHFDLSQFQVHVIVFNPSPNQTYEEPLRRLGISIWNIPVSQKGIIGRLRFLYPLLRRLQPTIIHSWTFHDNVYAGLVGWLIGAKVRWGSLRNSYYAQEVKKLPALYRWLSLHAVQKIVVNSTALQKELITIGYTPQKITVLPNCVQISLDKVAADLSELGITSRQPIVGIVGNLRPQKNLLLFVEGMAQLLPHHPQAMGIIVGQPVPGHDGVVQEIQEAICRHKLEKRILFTGFREDVPALMHCFTLLALTSHYEGVPNVIMEAMAAARPVIATAIGGVPDLIRHGENGLLIPPNNPQAFAQAADFLLTHPEQAQKMGQIGKQRVIEQFSCPQIAHQLQNHYRAALQ